MISFEVEAASPSSITKLTDEGSVPTVTPQIQLGFKFIGIPEAVYQRDRARIDKEVETNDLVALVQIKEADVISTPTVTTLPGLKANVDILREVPYPSKVEKEGEKWVVSETKNEDIGVSAEATPRFSANGKVVEMVMSCRLATIVDRQETHPGIWQPKFFVLSRRTNEITGLPGTRTLWLGSAPVEFDPTTSLKSRVPMRIIVAVSVERIPAGGP